MSRRAFSDQQRERAALLASIAAKRNVKLSNNRHGRQACEDPQTGTASNADSKCQDLSELQHAAEQPALKVALKRIWKRAPTDELVDAAAECMTALSISSRAAGEVDSPVVPSPPAIELPDSEGSKAECRQTASSTVPRKEPEEAVGLELGENKQFKLQKVVSQILYDHQVSLSVASCLQWPVPS